MDKNKENNGIAPAETDKKEPQHDLFTEKGQSKNEKDAFAKQLDDYKDSLQRLQAEFENYKKYIEKRNSDISA